MSRITNSQLLTVLFGNVQPVTTGRPNRLGLIVQNRSVSNVYLTFGVPPSVINGFYDGIEIPPNGYLAIDQNCPTETVYLRPDSIGGTVVYFVEIYGSDLP